MWTVQFTTKVGKNKEKLPKKIEDSFLALILEMERLGAVRHTWPHFNKLSGSHQSYHCHLKGSKKPTYVTCWHIVDKDRKIIEVYYVGTHENAPY